MLLPSSYDAENESQQYLSPTPLIIAMMLTLAYGYWRFGGAQLRYKGPKRGREAAGIDYEEIPLKYGSIE